MTPKDFAWLTGLAPHGSLRLQSWHGAASQSHQRAMGGRYDCRVRFHCRIGLGRHLVGSQPGSSLSNGSTTTKNASTISRIFWPDSPLAGKDRTATKAQLQKFYVEVGELLDITLPGDISAEDFKKYESSTEQRIKNMARWIGDNMGPAALARFTDRSGMSEVRYRKALNRTHNLMTMDQTRYRQNLLAMIESSAWDKN